MTFMRDSDFAEGSERSLNGKKPCAKHYGQGRKTGQKSLSRCEFIANLPSKSYSLYLSSINGCFDCFFFLFFFSTARIKHVN